MRRANPTDALRNTWAWKSFLTATAAGAAPLCAVGCSVLLNDPGGYYVADAATARDSGPAIDAAQESDAGSAGEENAGDDAADDAADDTGFPPDAPIEAGGVDGSTCPPPQILDPTDNAMVTSPVHLLSSWQSCWSYIDCYIDGSPSPLPNGASTTGPIDIMVSTTVGAHHFTCSAVTKAMHGLPAATANFTVVVDGGADQ